MGQTEQLQSVIYTNSILHSKFFLYLFPVLCLIFTCVSYAEARNRYRLDVRPSVTRWHGIKTAERMISSPHDSPFILVLCTPKSSRNYDGVTPCGGAKYKWGIKFARFSTNKSRKRYKISPWLLWKANRNSYAIYQIVPFPMTLKDPIPRFQGQTII